jgi:hypothetical protein
LKRIHFLAGVSVLALASLPTVSSAYVKQVTEARARKILNTHVANEFPSHHFETTVSFVTLFMGRPVRRWTKTIRRVCAENETWQMLKVAKKQNLVGDVKLYRTDLRTGKRDIVYMIDSPPVW